MLKNFVYRLASWSSPLQTGNKMTMTLFAITLHQHFISFIHFEIKQHQMQMVSLSTSSCS